MNNSIKTDIVYLVKARAEQKGLSNIDSEAFDSYMIDHIKRVIHKLESGELRTGDHISPGNAIIPSDRELLVNLGYTSIIVEDSNQLISLLHDKLAYFANND